ncbi:hypothetical protein D3C75_994190 [compost metagenome]
MQDLPAAVPRLGRLRPLGAEIQLAINVVLNQGNLPLTQQTHQPLLVVVRQAGPQRVLEVGHQPTGLDRILLQRLFERIEINSVLRVSGNRHRLQTQPLQCL